MLSSSVSKTPYKLFLITRSIDHDLGLVYIVMKTKATSLPGGFIENSI